MHDTPPPSRRASLTAAVFDRLGIVAGVVMIALTAVFRHKGLPRYHETGSLAGIQPRHASRLRMLLAAFHSSHVIGDMDIPGRSFLSQRQRHGR